MLALVSEPLPNHFGHAEEGKNVASVEFVEDRKRLLESAGPDY